MSWGRFSGGDDSRKPEGSEGFTEKTDSDPFASNDSDEDPFATTQGSSGSFYTDSEEKKADQPSSPRPRTAAPPGLPPPDPTPRLPNGQPVTGAPAEQQKQVELTMPLCGLVGVGNFLKGGQLGAGRRVTILLCALGICVPRLTVASLH